MKQEQKTPDLQNYIQSLSVGKSIVVTADLLNAMSKALGVIEQKGKEIKRLKKNHNLSRLASQRKYAQMKSRANIFEARTKIAETALLAADAYLNGVFLVDSSLLSNCAATPKYEKHDWYGLFMSLAERIIIETTGGTNNE